MTIDSDHFLDAARYLLDPLPYQERVRRAQRRELAAIHEPRLTARLSTAIVELPFRLKHGKWPDSNLAHAAARRLYGLRLDSLRLITPQP